MSVVWHQSSINLFTSSHSKWFPTRQGVPDRAHKAYLPIAGISSPTNLVWLMSYLYNINSYFNSNIQFCSWASSGCVINHRFIPLLGENFLLLAILNTDYHCNSILFLEITYYSKLNLLDITSKIRIIAMFVMVHL